MVEARAGGGGVGREPGWGTVGWGWEEGGARAPQTKRLDEAASADHIARTAPRRAQTLGQGHQSEQAAQGGPVCHPYTLTTASRRGPAV